MATYESVPANRYSTVAVTLHWLIALLIIVNIVLGIGHDFVSRDIVGKVMGYHKSIGLTVLVLSLARLAWRLGHPVPPLPAMPGWQVVTARLTHFFFYVAMIGLPLTGWLMSSASPMRFPLQYFGLFDIPFLPVEQSGAAAGLWAQTHVILAFTTIAVLFLHIAGALKHHYFDKDNVLTRMLPW